MSKSNSLFSQGMKIIALEAGSTRWIRTGENISYVSNQFPRTFGRYHTLSWRTTMRAGQPVLFAYSQPYLYSQLNLYLDNLEFSSVVKRSILCRTMLSNDISDLRQQGGFADSFVWIARK